MYPTVGYVVSATGRHRQGLELWGKSSGGDKKVGSVAETGVAIGNEVLTMPLKEVGVLYRWACQEGGSLPES